MPPYKAAITGVCRVLRAYGVAHATAETFRQAKFDTARAVRDGAVGARSLARALSAVVALGPDDARARGRRRVGCGASSTTSFSSRRTGPFWEGRCSAARWEPRGPPQDGRCAGTATVGLVLCLSRSRSPSHRPCVEFVAVFVVRVLRRYGYSRAGPGAGSRQLLLACAWLVAELGILRHYATAAAARGSSRTIPPYDEDTVRLYAKEVRGAAARWQTLVRVVVLIDPCAREGLAVREPRAALVGALQVGAVAAAARHGRCPRRAGGCAAPAA